MSKDKQQPEPCNNKFEELWKESPLYESSDTDYDIAKYWFDLGVQSSSNNIDQRVVRSVRKAVIWAVKNWATTRISNASADFLDPKVTGHKSDKACGELYFESDLQKYLDILKEKGIDA